MENINYCKCGCGCLVQKNYKKGHGRKGKKNSLEHNLKISKYNKENPPSLKMSDEKKLKMIEKLKSIKVPLERKLRISETSKKNGVGKWMTGRKLSEITKEKISKSLKGHETLVETRKKISNKNSGENNGMYGKTHSDEYKEKLRQNVEILRKNAHTPESIEKMRKKQIGKKTSEETKKKMRLSAINHIINKNNNICPMHNVKACDYFNNLSIEKNWNLQHALNGGELYISNLGYFIDAYDKDKNIVVEYDEPRHYDSKGNLKQKDIIRQNNIINELKCKFYRYNQKINTLYEVVN